jgi:hypothetical protein
MGSHKTTPPLVEGWFLPEMFSSQQKHQQLKIFAAAFAW